MACRSTGGDGEDIYLMSVVDFSAYGILVFGTGS
jgi:hypothetical protein